MGDPFWFADEGEEGWQPTLAIDGMMFELEIWFNTKEECEAFMAKIPAGTVIDG